MNEKEKTWKETSAFGTGSPVMFQNRAPNNNNFEVVVQENDHLRHYWFDYGRGGWNQGQSFGTNVQAAPTMFQNHDNYHYELVVQEGFNLQHYWFDYGGQGVWNK
ncbi:MAG: hypothetical protein ACXV7G_09725, partial [Halobacteriota archaeon]